MALPEWLRRFGWIGAVAVALAIWALDASARWQILESANSYGRTALPATDPISPTGYEFGQRARLQLSTDSYQWTLQTQEMLARGDLRVRFAEHDNAPAGREVHWGSPLRWWVALVAQVDAARTGTPRSLAVERAAGYAGPWLLALLLIALTPAVARRFGGVAAAVFGGGLVCVAPISSAFAIGTIDHHGIAVIAALVCALALAAAPGAKVPRRWVILSGIAGGTGLWISAATQVPVLAGLGLGALIAAWMSRKDVAPAVINWRTWGIAGALTSLAAYLLEYFPGHLGWRLEVNHPLYALAWWGAGEILHQLTRGMRGEFPWGRGRERGLAVAALAAVLTLPAAIVFGGPETFWVSDPLLWSIHADYIEEFAPLATEFRRADGLPAWVVLLLVVTVLPLLAGPVLRAGLRRETNPAVRTALWLSVAPALVTFALALAQKRWLHVAGGLWLGMLVVFVGAVATGLLPQWRSAGRRWLLGVFAALVLLPFPVAVARQRLALSANGPEVGPGELRELAVRDVARWLRRRAGGEPAIVLSDPTTTTQLAYFGGLRGVGTLYWENLPGLRAAYAMAGAGSAEEAEALFRARGITHLVVISWRDFADESARLAQGVRSGQPAPREGFLQALQSGRVPAWLRPVSYRLPVHPSFRGEYAAVFEGAFGQAPADAGVHQARYLLANGDVGRATALLADVLRAEPDHVPALSTSAQIHLGRRDPAGLDLVWPRLLAAVARDATIAPEDRLVIVQCLLAAGRREDARGQLARFWQDADERSLRRLNPGALAHVSSLARELGVTPAPPVAALVDRLLMLTSGP